MLKNWCFQSVVLEKTLESPLESKEIKPVNPKGHQPWIFFGRTEAESPVLGPLNVKSPIHWKRPVLKDWEGLKSGEEGDRGQDGWVSSLTKWTWTWANFGRWWGTGKPSVLKPMEWWREGHDLAAEQQWQQQAEGRKVGRSPLACPLSWKQLGVSCGLSADCGQGCL